MKTSSATKQDFPTNEENLLYQALCTLNIVSSARQEGIEVNRTAFRRSNNKALEYVLYRYYAIIEGKGRAQKDFKGIWPVIDKQQQMPFYQRMCDWMNDLKKAGRLDPSVILPVSALKTNTSNRLVVLLLDLANVALRHDVEVHRPGTSQGLYMQPLQAPSVVAVPSLEHMVPPETQLRLATIRTKAACRSFLNCTSSASSACDALNERCAPLKQLFYGLTARVREQEAALAAHGGAAPYNSGGTTDLVQQAVEASSGLGGSMAFGGSIGGSEGVATGHANEPMPNVSALLLELDAFLQVHVELAKVLPTTAAPEGPQQDHGGMAQAQRAGPLAPQQQLHRYQVDGGALAAATLGAPSTTHAVLGPQQLGRPQQQQYQTAFPPDNIVKAAGTFASALHSLVPNLNHLAMAGENAGPPPLLQPPTAPSSHAAHTHHALQVHGTSCHQISQLDSKVQQLNAECDRVLGELHREYEAFLAANGEQQHDEDDGFTPQVLPTLQLPMSRRRDQPSQSTGYLRGPSATAAGAASTGVVVDDELDRLDRLSAQGLSQIGSSLHAGGASAATAAAAFSTVPLWSSPGRLTTGLTLNMPGMADPVLGNPQAAAMQSPPAPFGPAGPTSMFSPLSSAQRLSISGASPHRADGHSEPGLHGFRPVGVSYASSFGQTGVASPMLANAMVNTSSFAGTGLQSDLRGSPLGVFSQSRMSPPPPQEAANAACSLPFASYNLNLGQPSQSPPVRDFGVPGIGVFGHTAFGRALGNDTVNSHGTLETQVSRLQMDTPPRNGGPDLSRLLLDDDDDPQPSRLSPPVAVLRSGAEGAVTGDVTHLPVTSTSTADEQTAGPGDDDGDLDYQLIAAAAEAVSHMILTGSEGQSPAVDGAPSAFTAPGGAWANEAGSSFLARNGDGRPQDHGIHTLFAALGGVGAGTTAGELFSSGAASTGPFGYQQDAHDDDVRMSDSDTARSPNPTASTFGKSDTQGHPPSPLGFSYKSQLPAQHAAAQLPAPAGMQHAGAVQEPAVGQAAPGLSLAALRARMQAVTGKT